MPARPTPPDFAIRSHGKLAAILFAAGSGALIATLAGVVGRVAGARFGLSGGLVIGGAGLAFVLASLEVFEVTTSLSFRGHRSDEDRREHIGERESFGAALAVGAAGLGFALLYFLIAWPGVRLARALGLYHP